MYVYKYVDIKDQKVKYVGKTTNINKRIKDHERDKWFLNSTYDIYYIECNTKADMDCLETYFIGYYGSCEYYNVAKNWGNVTLNLTIDENQWILYLNPKDQQIKRLEERRENIRKLKKDIISLDVEISKLQDSIKNKEKAIASLNSNNNNLDQMLDDTCQWGLINQIGFSASDIRYLFENFPKSFDRKAFISNEFDHHGKQLWHYVLEINSYYDDRPYFIDFLSRSSDTFINDRRMRYYSEQDTAHPHLRLSDDQVCESALAAILMNLPHQTYYPEDKNVYLLIVRLLYSHIRNVSSRIDERTKKSQEDSEAINLLDRLCCIKGDLNGQKENLSGS